ncbi:UDP-N-acetylmuramate--L-alanine ligase [Deinococcus psychrotolerans]|uniref:UDP-N-acetylmuramate--L-alanine ligase n=1 Tax=Deinococcus psychrotolerans TaxID=2489213 RepID=A0A3G8YRY9_9DEIO|nr:UDP-N-acetylmuramate--L-alanine ligase [Deinococcus psychrotolerans]AZI43966.1 UDP-N-acetylmuramate--L-alanine ligase [Deinococcus psychrotolerans]
MGIGGIGVSAFARLLKARGYIVSGCDEHPSELTAQLEREGITVAHGHDPAHVHGVDVLIASEAVSKNHPELSAARQAHIEVRPRMALLAELLSASPSVGVVGTHGKTTTTSMIAVALLGAGLDPAALVGGIVPEFDLQHGGSNARIGQGPFVAEVDESDRNFQYAVCQTAVFTNAEDDHVGGAEGSELATYWSSVEEQHAAFTRFVSQAERVLYCADWPGLDAFVTQHQSAMSYGTLEGSTYRATQLQPDETGTSFQVSKRGELLGQARINLPGTHNVLNALAALAVTDLYGGEFESAAAALAAFRGPGRRWQHIGSLNGALIVDDYAHNATKVAAAVQAAQQTGRRVRVVFQPHRYLRTQQSWPRLADALMKADEVLILDIAAASEPPIEGIHATLISERMKQGGHPAAEYYPQREDAVEYLRASAQPRDIIVTMGAGDVWKMARQLAGVPL